MSKPYEAAVDAAVTAINTANEAILAELRSQMRARNIQTLELWEEDDGDINQQWLYVSLIDGKPVNYREDEGSKIEDLNEIAGALFLLCDLAGVTRMTIDANS